MEITFYPLSLLILSFLIWIKSKSRGGFLNLSYITIFIFSLWLTLVYIFINSLTGRGIDEAAIFHVGVIFDAKVWLQFWEISLLVIILAIISFILFYKFSKKRRSRGEVRMIWLAHTSLFLGLLFHPATSDIHRIVKDIYTNHGPDILGIELERQTDSVQAINPRSFVYLYLESLDQVFLDEKKFPGLMPELSKIIKKSGQINGLHQAPMTGWTMAGLVSTQCGLPLARAATSALNVTRNSIPICVGDILKEHDYYLSFMGGADLTFVGKGLFYKLHGFKDVFGASDLEELAGKRLERSQWGVFDDDLLDLAWQRVEQLSSKPERFGLVLLTVDTHPPHGHKTPSCKGIKYGSGESGVLNSVHCTDYLVSKFIKKFLSSEKTNDVALIISSDHLMMANDANIEINEEKRNNTFVFFNASQENEVLITRQASMLDIAPTLLHLIGFDVETLGFGRNLYKGNPTLSEKYGKKEFYRLIHVWGNVLQSKLSRDTKENKKEKDL